MEVVPPPKKFVKMVVLGVGCWDFETKPKDDMNLATTQPSMFFKFFEIKFTLSF
jgi:hypothetical protein